jgi:CRISPR-associated protein (TIGR03986 family)
MSAKLPRHIEHVPDNRKAIAPYNFVELPDKIVEAEPLRDGDRYHGDRYTGKIECTLTTSSPLYIRCGLTISDFKEEKESKDNPEFFYTADKLKPVIPGSSLRGMLRTLVEIITFSKIDRVAGQDRFFFRAVAADKDDPLKEIYSDNHKNIKAGYLNKDSQDRWFIVPAKEPSEKESYISFKEKEFKNDLPSLVTMEKSEYLPQYIPVSVNISNGRITAISEDTSKLDIKGHLVTSGNMLETSSLTESERMAKLNEKSGRKKHYVVLDKNNLKPAIYIEKYAVDNYCNSLTSFQDGKLFESNPKNPFNNKMGMFEINRPIFYCQPAKGKLVTLFGQSPNFRIPFSPLGDGQAATARDFIPEVLKDPEGEDEGREPAIDIAEGIFGYVRGNKFENQARSGRVSISAATCISTDDVLYEQEPIIPKILASPKPTTFQHYLVQPEDTKAEKSKLMKHYASQGTVIRGHKLYWHQKSTPKIKHPNPEEAAEKQATQITKIKPIKAGVSFNFNVHFENLSNIELGALLWILDIAQDDDYRLSLGMGKPLGMGAVKIEYQLYLSKRRSRYESLFANKSWEISEKAEGDPSFASEFENYMAEELEHVGNFKKHRRIEMLLKMLNWKDSPKDTETRYMEIECEEKPLHGGDSNEYKARFVLPTPLDVRDSDRKNNKDVLDSDRKNKVSPPNPVIIKKADREVTPSNSSDESSSEPIQKYQVGEIVKATITKISGNDVTYDFAHAPKRTEKKCKQAISLQEGQSVFVKIVAIKEDGSMKNVKYDRA